MTGLAWRRMRSARLVGEPLDQPAEVVRWFGAVQSQDYGPAKWAVGMRAKGATDASLDAALNAGEILRTHALRPTWHFLDPADLRWVQELTGPRVHALNAYYCRQLELDDATLARTADLLARWLRGGTHLTRKELKDRFDAADVGTQSFRMAYILMHAELNSLICNGPLRGRQHTYALLDEWAPAPPGTRSREEALAELTLRYFTSHGPATVKDFRWWSSLTVADITAGLDLVGDALHRETVDGMTLWSAPGLDGTPEPGPTAHLLQGYDEYAVAFSESKHLLDASGEARAHLGGERSVFVGLVIVDSQLAGHWKRHVGRDTVSIEVEPYHPLGADRLRAVELAAARHGEFLGLPATLLVRG